MIDSLIVLFHIILAIFYLFICSIRLEINRPIKIFHNFFILQPNLVIL